MMPALALEIFHTYSLIHDDLPAMDDADLRRGEPTLHTRYDEALAILAGDALNTHAFELLSRSAFRADVRIELVRILAENGGSGGMVLGQAIDLHFEKTPLNLEQVVELHINKTAKLIAAALEMGAVIVDLPAEIRKELYRFGIDLGLLFQVQDDILDATQSTEEAGKPTGHDTEKNSFVTLLGLEGAIAYADGLAEGLQERFESFDAPLKQALAPLMEHYLFRHRPIEKK
jgi:farnesyl diphosphate synthase